MAWAERRKLIGDIEAKRGSRVLCYLTSDRQGATGQIAQDAVPWLYSHLVKLGKCDSLDLFIYSTGGMTMAAWRIVRLLREFGKRLAVLIPYKAHSAATLIALGADEIVTLPASELSPVDPSTQTPFNPAPMPGMPPVPVQVEDAIGYIRMAEDKAHLSGENALTEVFRILADKVHPLALGHVFRAHEQIRMLAGKLLELHMEATDERIERIIRQVTEELHSHDYPISRVEAQAMGLPVQKAEDEGIGDALWSLYEDYRHDLQLLTPWTPELCLQGQDEAKSSLELALVESACGSDVFMQEKSVRRIALQQSPAPGAPPIVVMSYQEIPLAQGWHRKEWPE